MDSNRLNSEKDIYRAMADLLDNQNLDKMNIDPDGILAFLESAGMRLVPKIREMIRWHIKKAINREIIRSIIKACRGGGKTFSVSAGVEFPLFYYFDYDCVNLGGSRTQADKAYEIITNLLAHPKVTDRIKTITKKKTEKNNGTWISVLSASTTSVRSPHPGGVNKGGLLYIDEECEIKPGLVSDAKPVVDAARPSAIVRSSTQHKLDDSFEDCWDNAKEQGYKQFSWDAFDVCEHCTRKCWVSVKDDPKNGCYDILRKDTYDTEGRIKEHGFCKGRAHHDGYKYNCDKDGKWTKQRVRKWSKWNDQPEGWISIDEILQAVRENDKETFMVEYLGRKRRKKGKVYDSQLLDESVVESLNMNDQLFKSLPKSIGVDWGYSGETCVTYSFIYKKCIWIYWVDYYTETDLDVIVSDIDTMARRGNHEEAYGDSEGAFENTALSRKLVVYNVAFGTWKDFGIKHVRNITEKHKFRILMNWAGKPVPHFEKFMKQLKGYRYDEHGKPVKKDDHGPDSLLCNTLKWAPRRKDLKGKGKQRTVSGQPIIHIVK